MILGIDIGFSALGWSHVCPNGFIQEVGLCRTAKQQELTLSVDALSRCLSLSDQLESVISSRECGCIVAEAPSYPRSASTSIKLGMAWGALCSISERHNIQLYIVSPSTIRSHFGLKRGADKQALSDTLLGLLPDAHHSVVQHYPAALRQHIIDASLCALTYHRKGKTNEIIKPLQARAASSATSLSLR